MFDWIARNDVKHKLGCRCVVVFAVIKARYQNRTLDWLNSHVPTIQFTIEVEEDGALPFLDLRIHRKEDDSIKFSIYRKPTSKERYIMKSSFHHGTHKAAAFNSMIHRALNIPLEDEDREIERNKIFDIAKVNGYDLDFIENLYQRHLGKKNLKDLTSLEPLGSESRRIAVPYFPTVTNRLKQVLKPFDIQLVASSQYTLRKKLCNYKDKPPPSGASGIYRVPCIDCDSVYIGQTRRSIATRLQEHAAAISSSKIERSSVAEHAVEHSHSIDMINADKVKTVNKNYKLDAWESLFMANATTTLMNREDAPIISLLFGLVDLSITL